MSGLILLCVSAAPPRKKTLSTAGSKPLLVNICLGAQRLKLRTVRSNVFEYLNLPNIYNQIVTATLPFI